MWVLRALQNIFLRVRIKNPNNQSRSNSVIHPNCQCLSQNITAQEFVGGSVKSVCLIWINLIDV